MKVKKLAQSMRTICKIILVLLLVVSDFTNNIAIDKNENTEDSNKTKAHNVVNAVKGIVAAAAIVKLTLAEAMERIKC
ncbi:hypothetical protein SLEP1_g56987 [Rubroshorea leprosula]|uniref:Variable large protein n=1 Tax=Rubroshorea leprosula TaxID=152421 RepID=A0AAV5MMP1_9ROSI|nr:hypothetical protein SLEP1_g56987 [Rubroshorea leprosula]